MEGYACSLWKLLAFALDLLTVLIILILCFAVEFHLTVLFTALCTLSVQDLNNSISGIFCYYFFKYFFLFCFAFGFLLGFPSLDVHTFVPLLNFISCLFCLFIPVLSLLGEFHPVFQLTNLFSVCSCCAFNSSSEFFISNYCIFNTHHLILIPLHACFFCIKFLKNLLSLKMLFCL